MEQAQSCRMDENGKLSTLFWDGGLAVYYSDDPPMNELDEFEDKCAFTGRYIDNAQRQLDIESDT
ncbi:hypothetical protein OROHE_016114 [Orobanche hederae]